MDCYNIEILHPFININYTPTIHSYRQKFQINNRLNFSPLTYNNSKKVNTSYVLIYDHATGSVAMNLNQLENLDKLREITKFEDNWNGYGANPFSNKVIEKSIQIIKNIETQPKLFPTGRSSIQMQYELEDNSYLEFEIFDDKISCMEVPKRVYNKAIFREFNHDKIDFINKIVRGFYGEQSTSRRDTI